MDSGAIDVDLGNRAEYRGMLTRALRTAAFVTVGATPPFIAVEGEDGSPPSRSIPRMAATSAGTSTLDPPSSSATTLLPPATSSSSTWWRTSPSASTSSWWATSPSWAGGRWTSAAARSRATSGRPHLHPQRRGERRVQICPLQRQQRRADLAGGRQLRLRALRGRDRLVLEPHAFVENLTIEISAESEAVKARAAIAEAIARPRLKPRRQTTNTSRGQTTKTAPPRRCAPSSRNPKPSRRPRTTRTTPPSSSPSRSARQG